MSFHEDDAAPGPWNAIPLEEHNPENAFAGRVLRPLQVIDAADETGKRLQLVPGRHVRS
ncbi:hypothetical protein [Arthrobacter sp. efr-133-R2A-120]|uniref:hypothetical protein n=1 Tax=unclassified Arthrobacter TaxID=235627 RepID=UPI00254FB800|nr:hypothetical protein [Arthrobacter sp. efr-133-R2A-120]